jgi:hypothetical protein
MIETPDLAFTIEFDTTPLAQVTNAFLLINQAEVKVLVARYNCTIKKVFLAGHEVPEKKHRSCLERFDR